MQLTEVVTRLKKIDELQRTVEALQQSVAEMQLLLVESSLSDKAAGQMAIPDDVPDTPAFLSDWELARRIERHITSRIHTWKWARHYQGGMCCPLTASDISQRIGLNTNKVRMLIDDRDLWLEVRWMQLPFAKDHPEYGKSDHGLHVIVRGKETA